MGHMTAEASQTFLRRVILPLAGLMAILMLSAVAGIFWIANYQTTVAIGQQVRLANGALRIQADRLAVSAGDYGYWDDAVAAIVDTPDPSWISENIGSGAEKSLGVAMSFVLDPDGRAIYSRIGGVDGREDPTRFFPQGFREAHAEWEALPAEKTYSGVVPYGNAAALIAIASVRPWEDRNRASTGYSLLFVQLLDGQMLKSLSRDYALSNLRVVQPDIGISDLRATLAITDGKGRMVSRLAWDPERPGDRLLLLVLPFMAVFMTLLVVLGVVGIRYALDSVQLINDREKKAFHDPLTNLANRAMFFAQVDKALRKAGDGSSVSVMYVDLDGFKTVNDSQGHGAGDILLQQVASRLTASVRAGDLVARLGGDEFAILFTGSISADDLARIGEGILRDIAMAFHLPRGATHVSCSIGIATGVDPAEGAFDLVGRADAALYRAKARGKNRLDFDVTPSAHPVDRDAA
jgi:diguanylate cyclase (GGDEF)-like protein